MKLATFWVLSRGWLLLGAAVISTAIAAHGFGRALFCALTVVVTALAVTTISTVSEQWFQSEPEALGSRRGLALWAADSAALTLLAWFLPGLTVNAGLAPFYALYPLAPVLKAVALLAVAYAWVRVIRTGDPATRAGFLHPILVLITSLLAWFLVDRILPSGWGTEQAAFSIALAAASVALIVGVRLVVDVYRGIRVRSTVPA